MTTKEDILAAIARLGSVSAAARELSMTRQAISKQFRRLPSDDPLRIRYEALAQVSKRGPEAKWTDQGERNRSKDRAYRARQKTRRNLRSMVDEPGSIN